MRARATIQRVLGLLLAMFSTTMLLPIVVSLIFGDGQWLAFAGSFLIILGSGVVIWWPVREQTRELRLREGFLVVAAFWIVLGLFGSVPLLLTDNPQLSLTDAVFESMSGLTTTGATVLTGLAELPESILFYRQQLQWFGGLGIIVLAVAVLPMLGVGGMQLYRAETPGPVKDTRLTPRITETAKALWYVYLGITVLCALAYLLAGMGLFDAICHAFSTVAIGGFSTYDESFGYFDSAAIELVAVVFMFVSGVNFSLHFLAWRHRSVKHYFQDPEFRAYAKLLGGLIAVVVVYLYAQGYYPTLAETLTHGLFQTVSIATTTGFTTADFAVWPGVLPVLLIFSSFCRRMCRIDGRRHEGHPLAVDVPAGAQGSAAAGSPSAEVPVKLGSKAVPSRVVDAVWGFFAVYVVVFSALLLILVAAGLDQVSAFSAVAATLNNLGPGLGEVASGFGGVGIIEKWAAVCAMLLGRLEIFTLLVLITPTFWRP